MSNIQYKNILKNILENMPSDWLKLTTHRLDIYKEEFAKVEFLEQFENILNSSPSQFNELLKNLPTAFDYIRLGHPLSCLLEWSVAKLKNISESNVISFSSQAMPLLAILRKNLLEGKSTYIYYKNELPKYLEEEIIKKIYGYKLEFININKVQNSNNLEGSTVLISSFDNVWESPENENMDFIVNTHPDFGSIVLINGEENKEYLSEILHVRRRESIAMTPHDCLTVLEKYAGNPSSLENIRDLNKSKKELFSIINKITNTSSTPSIGSSGLSVQYAIMMGLIHHSIETQPGKKIKFIVPPNCYGGTNDQARRVAACVSNVDILDLPVDGGNDMVNSIKIVLDQVAYDDAIPFIIAEIPTNPRVEVPDLIQLREALIKIRMTSNGTPSIPPVFILDQTFCPNMNFLGEEDVLSGVKTVSYVSGSKFPSGGLCTAGYCVANKKAEGLMEYIQRHLSLCDNEATDFQIETLTKEMPSMIKRIDDAYRNTREFVNFIQDTLPESKINFVSEDLAQMGFTPSVFSLDLPTKGDHEEDKENYKRDLNLKLIKMMIDEIPHESKHCVSYGQLKGCYWTVPATSTQGTTKEGDKDYIVRVSFSPKVDLALHKKVFSDFCSKHIIK